VLAGATVVLMLLRQSVVLTLIGAGAVGALIAAAGGPLPT
jgi:chromate transporter